MKSLSRYAFINAKIRACLSRFLKTSDWEGLKTCVAFDDFRLRIASTRYEDIFGSRGSAIVEDSYEQQLDQLLADDYKFVLKNTSGYVFDFVSLMQLSHKISVFRQFLRNFIVGNKTYQSALYQDCFPDEAMQSATIEEFVMFFKGTFFYAPLQESIKNLKINKNAFLTEMYLDKAYYETLWDFANNMSKKDKVITVDFLKLKTDILNIKIIYRMRKYLKFSGKEIEDYLVRPYGEMDSNILGFLYGDRKLSQVLLTLFGKHTVGADFMFDLENQKQDDNFLFNIDVFLNTLLITMGKKIITGSPFSVSLLWFFFLLNETEINNVRYIMRSVLSKNRDNLLQSILVDVGR